MAGTKAPSGLYQARSNMKFTFNWKISDSDYEAGQQLRWRYYTRKGTSKSGAWTNWIDVGIGAKVTSKAVSLNAASFFPNTQVYLFGIQFQVRGKRKNTTKDGKTTTYDWSGWSSNTWDFIAPPQPSKLSVELDDELYNRSVFAWENKSASDTDGKPWYDMEYQTMLVKNSKQTDGSKLTWKSSQPGWGSYTGGKTGSRTHTEDTQTLADGASYTRWVRVRARGAGGNGGLRGLSYWRYQKHVYARPLKPTIDKVTSSVSGGNTTIQVTWTADAHAARPIDKTVVQYAIDTPLANLAPPNDTSWTDVVASADTGGKDAARITINEAPSTDECLWVRVMVEHDPFDTSRNYSDPKLVRTGALAAPTGLSISAEESTYRITVTATNESDVPDARLAIIFRQVMKDKSQKDTIVGVSTVGSGAKEVTVQCPNWSGFSNYKIGVYAFQEKTDDITYKTLTGSVRSYSLKPGMKSSNLWTGGDAPAEPTGVSVELSDTPGEVILMWNWSWANANRAEISWSQNPNAWESTDEPETYVLNNTRAARWRISGLAVGVTWYFCVRLIQVVGDGETYSPYSDPVSIDLSSAPAKPILSLSKAVITQGESFSASWIFSSTDDTQQGYAEIRQVSDAGAITGGIIAKTTTAQNVNIAPPSNWELGNAYRLAVKVTSASGRDSEWSDPVPIIIAEPVECSIDETSLEEITIGTGEEERTVLALTEMPLTATILGAGEGGMTTLTIIRAKEYHIIRPDESVLNGFDGETTVLLRQSGEEEIEVTNDDLIGLLDDGAQYRLIATVEDDLGQADTQTLDFEVHWTHQAEVPTATVEMSGNAAIITPVAPESAEAGDVVDIYRLTADLPELIISGGEYGEAYVDPYPAIGRGFGHRIVDRTVNNDYITEDNTPAWIDLTDADGDLLDVDYGIIDFNGTSIRFQYNMTVSGSWKKDFKETKYLGGSITGDWNPGVSRTGTINADIVTDDLETFSALRRLAEYTGICHVRTPDGSSYSADVQIGDGLGYDSAGKINEVTLTITRVDPETLDGLRYDEWKPEGATGATGATGESG